MRPLDHAVQKTERILLTANCLTAFFCLLVAGERLSNGSGGPLYAYLLGLGGYLLLLYRPAPAKGKTAAGYFAVMIGLLLYVHWHTPDEVATVLFYLLVVQQGVLLPRRYSLPLAAVTAAAYVGSALLLGKGNGQPVLWGFMHALLMLNMHILARHLAHLERTARQQNRKIEELLQQTEQSYRQAAVLAERDDLTGLYNYRTFQQQLQARIAQGISLLLVDIDFFKLFNDTYGHLCGDMVLREIGKILQHSFREEDMVFRYGGEEFAVLLHTVDEAVVQQAARRVSHNVARQPFCCDEEEALFVTVSIGYAVGESGCGSRNAQEELFRGADAALYRAKKNGRNLIGCPDGTIMTDQAVYIEPQTREECL